jgi:hypothetical protein
VICANWWARTLEISGKSAAEIGDQAGVNKTTIHRLKTMDRTTSGTVMDALAKAAGVPLPVLLDARDYAALYAARHPTARASTGTESATAARHERVKKLLPALAAAKKKPRRRAGGTE